MKFRATGLGFVHFTTTFYPPVYNMPLFRDRPIRTGAIGKADSAALEIEY